MHAACAVALAAALAASAGTAAAFDLTGNYTGKYKCSGFDGTKPKPKFTDAIPLAITQSGDVLGIDYDGGNFFYSGIALPDARKPDKGEIAVVICGTDSMLGGNVDYDEMGRLKVTTKPSKGAAKITGVSIYTDPDGATVYTCKWSFKRVDTVDPGTPTSCAP
jgi:hypothetical protein